MTYSIVARDKSMGQLGVAVQSAYFAVGSGVAWAWPGVGAVATQAIAEPGYGPRCLERLASGATATEALAGARSEDPLSDLRQVGVVGADGTVASFTGSLCVDHAGGVTGDGFAVQANMVRSPQVWEGIAASYTSSTGPLADRLLQALLGAESAGGDARGRMSAALLVVDVAASDQPGGGKVVDLRVDMSEDPLGQLAELLQAAKAFAELDAAVGHLTAGDASAALASAETGLRLLPGNGNLRLVRAGALLASGSTEAGTRELRSLVEEHRPWEVVIRSFASKQLISLPDGLSVDSVLS